VQLLAPQQRLEFLAALEIGESGSIRSSSARGKLGAPSGVSVNVRLWWQKWRSYGRNSMPGSAARIHREFARWRAFARWPVHGNVLEVFREGRLEVGEHALFEPHVVVTSGVRVDERSTMPGCSDRLSQRQHHAGGYALRSDV
jgi:hypothetical protein